MKKTKKQVYLILQLFDYLCHVYLDSTMQGAL